MRISSASSVCGLFQSGRLAVREIARPAIPGCQFLTRTKRVEEDEVVEPPGRFRWKGFEPAAAPRQEPELRKVRAASKSSGIFCAKTRSYSTGTGRRSADGVEFGAIDPAAIGKALQADQKRISGKGGGRGVRRISVAQRAQRQDLPKALAGGGQKIDKLVRGWPKIADTAARRQRRGV